MSEKTRVMYMHTLDGKPAAFSFLWQVIHRVPQRSLDLRVSLVPNLARIKVERQLSRLTLRREKRRIPRYDFVRVEIPSE